MPSSNAERCTQRMRYHVRGTEDRTPMGNITRQIVVGVVALLPLSWAVHGAAGIANGIAEPSTTKQTPALLRDMRTQGEKHGFAVAMEVDNWDGKYILHIKQRHNETTERGLLRVDPVIITVQESIQALLFDLRERGHADGAPLEVFLEGDIAPAPDFRPIREQIERLRRTARNADNLHQLLRTYYDEEFLQKFESLRIYELATINFLIAQALKPSGKEPDFLCVREIATADATPEELALMVGGAMRLHALGKVRLLPVEGKAEVSRALALVFKEGRELFNALSRSLVNCNV